MRPFILGLCCALVSCSTLLSQGGENVLLVVNRDDKLSRRIADYYVSKRSIPLKNVCKLNILEEDEAISWDDYVEEVERPVARCLAKAHLQEQVLYIVTTMGVPLKVSGGGDGPGAEHCAVDSELTLLYAKMKGKRFPRAGLVNNPFHRQKDQPFTHPRFPIYAGLPRLGQKVADPLAADFSVEECQHGIAIEYSFCLHRHGPFAADREAPPSGRPTPGKCHRSVRPDRPEAVS